MEFGDYVRLLRRRWHSVVVVVAACLIGAALVSVFQTPTYQATTEILVALPQGAVSPAPTVPTVAGDASTQASAQASAQAQVQAQAQNTVNFITNLPLFVGQLATIASTPPVVQAAVSAAGADGTAVSLSATAQTSTSVITVAVVSTDPQVAQSVANAFVGVLPDVLVSLNQLSVRDALNFRTLAPAALPTTPFRPEPVVDTALGLAVGLVLGLALAVAREALDRRIRDSRRIEGRTGVAVLGVIPFEHSGVALPTASHPDSARSEAYRKVRTSLLFSGADGAPRSLAVTSAVSEEGKTSLSVNLAVVCARAGQRVALVDADLRRPRVHEKLGLPNQTGLTNVLAGEATLDEVLQVDARGIAVVTAGPRPRDPSAMLESPELATLITTLEGRFDVVVVDSTPALAVSDAAQVAAVCGGVVLVCRLGQTTYDSLAKARQTLEQVKVTALGVVAVGNDEDPDAGYRYYESVPVPVPAHRLAPSPVPRPAGTGPTPGWRRLTKSS